MATTLIKKVLLPNSMGRLGNIHKGGKSLPSKDLNLVIDGTRVVYLRCFHDEKDIIHEETPSSTIH